MFLDANVFIHAYTNGASPKQMKCAALMERILSGEQRASTSSLVINESLFFFLGIGQIEIAERMHRNLLANPHLEILPVDKKVVEASFQYIKDGLQVTDAFHVATMRLNGISTICSYDKGFDKAKEISRQEPK